MLRWWWRYLCTFVRVIRPNGDKTVRTISPLSDDRCEKNRERAKEEEGRHAHVVDSHRSGGEEVGELVVTQRASLDEVVR